MKKINMVCKLVLPLLALISLSTQADDSCAQGCHIIKPYEQGVKDPNLLSSKHIQNGLTCVDCHEQDEATRAAEAQAYANGEYDDPMYQREFDSDFCLRCHDGYESLAKATHDLETQWGINPHHSHLDPECTECHKSHVQSEFVCAECHTAEWGKRLPEGWIVGS